jgi:transcriptional regulator with XRE-family HTH domain
MAQKTTPNNALRRERELRGWSQQYVAEQIKAHSPSYISRWERGTTTPTPYYRKELCRLFDKNAQELGFVREQEETPHEEPDGEPELALDTGLAPSREQERRKSALGRNTSWFTRPRRPFLVALLLLFLVVVSSLAISWYAFSPTRHWPRPQHNIRIKSSVVETLQYMLEARRYHLNDYGIDGLYGLETEDRIRDFQGAFNLPQNNGVDDSTWERLILTSKKGDRGLQVQALKIQLNAQNIAKPLLVSDDKDFDSAFDSATEQVVRQFQQTNDLPVTGKADLDVWCLLVGGYISRHLP